MNRPWASTISGTRPWKFSSQVSAVFQGVVWPAQLSKVPCSLSDPMSAAAGPSTAHGVKALMRRFSRSFSTGAQAPVAPSRRTRSTDRPTSRLKSSMVASRPRSALNVCG
jgi:hypothetical protein